MESELETIEVLNDLVQINNDCIEGYEKSIAELKEENQDLKSLFISMIDKSRKYKMALSTLNLMYLKMIPKSELPLSVSFTRLGWM